MQRPSNLSDTALLHELHAIVRSHRQLTADLILHLGEVDARRLHVEKGYSSLFKYCVERLAFSEDEACRRIEAARLARRFPVIYALVEAGSISLTVLTLLKPHLTSGNHQELLAGVSGSSSRQAKEWLAARFPEPDVPSIIRKLPERRAATVAPPLTPRAPAAPRIEGPAPALATEAPAAPRIEGALDGEEQALDATRPAAIPPPTPAPAPARARIEPLSRDRFLVKFTASRDLRDKLELARDLMSHANPGGDLAIVLARAVDLLITDLERKKLGRTSRPRKEPPSRHAAGSAQLPSVGGAPELQSAGGALEHPVGDARVTRATRRAVVARDGFRCSFVASDGQHCGARAFVEFDHETPKGRGGNSRPENLRLRCRAHNRAEAERVYGKAYVSQAISDSHRNVRVPSGNQLGLEPCRRGSEGAGRSGEA